MPDVVLDVCTSGYPCFLTTQMRGAGAVENLKQKSFVIKEGAEYR